VFIVIKEKKFATFQTRLESVNGDGLNIPKIMASYMCQYRGSLIGKHFKTLIQVIPFIVYDLVDKNLLDTWVILGRLCVLLWHTEIPDVEQYLVSLSKQALDFLLISAFVQGELQTVIDVFLTKASICAPSIITTKPKFHFLVHIPYFIRRFGPALLCSTERYESFNSVFRLGCIFSNRQAPSRDSANVFAHLDRVKHIASGGWWYDINQQRYVSASKAVTETICNNPKYSHLIGLESENTKIPGTYVFPYPRYFNSISIIIGQFGLLLPEKEQRPANAKKAKPLPPIPSRDTIIGAYLSAQGKIPIASDVYRCRFIIAQNGDVIKPRTAAILKVSS